MNEIERAIKSCENKISQYEKRLSGADFHRGATMNSIELERIKIAALREKQARESGCEYCMGSKMNYSPINEMFFDVDEIVARVTMTAKILFCPMCSRELEEHHDAD